jgi:hypothetical protein
MSGFYSNAFKVGVGLVANLGRFDGWGSFAAGFVEEARQSLSTGDAMLLLERRFDPVPNP